MHVNNFVTCFYVLKTKFALSFTQIGLVALGGSALLDEDERAMALFQKTAALLSTRTAGEIA